MQHVISTRSGLTCNSLSRFVHLTVSSYSNTVTMSDGCKPYNSTSVDILYIKPKVVTK